MVDYSTTTSKAYLQGVTSLMNVEWSKTFLWDIKFDTVRNDSSTVPPAPFDAWFPASDVNETAATATTLMEAFYLSNYKFLHGSSNMELSLNIHDDVNGTIYHWLLDWWRNALNDSDGVQTIEQAYRKIIIIKLSPAKEILKLYQYYVIPDGVITEILNSHADTKMYSINLAIVGREDPQQFTAQFVDESGTNNTVTSTAPTFSTTNF